MTVEGSAAQPVSEPVGRFVEWFALQLADAGLPRMTARVFVGILITDSGRCTAGELARLLRISPAAISGAVRQLVQLDLVRREREPGQRSDHYRLHDDMWYRVFARRDDTMARLETTLRAGLDVVGADSAAGRRLDETLRFCHFLRDEFGEMTRRWQSERASGGR